MPNHTPGLYYTACTTRHAGRARERLTGGRVRGRQEQVVAPPSRARGDQRRVTAIRRAAGVALGGAALLASLAGCSFKDAFAFGWPHGISPQARAMYNLWVGSTIAALAVGVFVWSLI